MRATPPQILADDREGAPRLPARVPDHELLRRIGRGAYGEVWLAQSVTGAFRAVKVVHRESFDHDRPFEREFQGILKFEPISRTHDSQVDILHVGRGEGSFFYVMELADDQVTGGQIHPARYAPRTLKSDLAFHGRLPFEECVRTGIALATALEHLHAHGLVHRDVKPSNIIFINGVPKLADIGLVASVDATRSHVGTEGFAAPEGPGTPRGDLYSLGKVLYEMATGKDRQDFPGLPTQLRELPDREGLMELNAVIARACRHDPNDRYVSAAAMRADLELLQSGKSLARLRRTQERLRAAQRVGAVVATVAVLVASGWYWQARQTRQVRDLAAERSRLVGEKTRLADENRERVVRLNVANGIREMDRRDLATALVWFGEALVLATNNPADAAIQRIRLQHLLAGHPRLLQVLPHPAGATVAEFAPDEQRLATGCADGSVRIWDTARDEMPAATFPSPGAIQRLRYTRDGRRLWVEWLDTGGAFRGAALLDAATGIPVFPPLAEVTGTELSPDDRCLAVARANGTVQFLRTDSGEVTAEAVGHSARIEGMRFSPDARQMLTASQDRTVGRWDVASGRPLGPRLLHDLPVAQAVWSREATRIASVTLAEETSGRIQFQTWDPARAAPLLAPLSGRGPRAALAFDGSGRRLVTTDREAAVRIWDADSHAMVAPQLALNSPVRCLEVSPDGAQVALGSEAGVVEVWDLETGQPVLPPLHNAGRVESVRYNRDGSRLLTASDDGTVKVWDLALAPADRLLQFLSHQHPAAAVSPDGRHLLLGVADVPARLHSVELPMLEASEPALPFATNFSLGGVVTFDASGRQWATAYNPEPYFRREGRRGEGDPATAGLWRREADGIRHFSLPHPSQVVGAFFHRDGHQLLTVGWDGLTRIWNTADGTLQQTAPRPSSDAAWIAVSPDLRTAVAVCQEAGGWHVVFREVPTGKRLGGPAKDNPDITTASFSPDGIRVATAGTDQHGRIWDARSGELYAPAFKHGGPLTCIEWSPDGGRLLTAGESPEVKVWDATTGLLVLPPLRMKNRPVERARFSADGRFIVARSDEDLVRVWDAATGEPVTPFLPHTDTIRDVFVTATPQLITIQNCGMIRAWDLSATPLAVPELVEFARLLAGGPAETNRSAGAHAADLAASFRGLRSRRPEWFTRPADQVAAWHRRAAREPATLVQTASALFHLERLAERAPGDPTIPSWLDRWRGLLIPPRDSATPPQLLDLTRAYTRSFDLLPRREFDELPRGRHTLGGTKFDLRGIVHLDRRAEPADAVGPFHPLAVIRVGQRCQRLHFLQATEGEPRLDGSVVARWIMHYADGSIREWPVIYGTHVRDAWWWMHQEPAEATQACVAWNGRAVGWNRPELGGVRLFQATWTNPQPDLEITRLEFRMGETALKPFVVAITAE